ncbi:unnamed protein product [Didymodactylos carnosus]|uniref:Uncharacterized protein n=1 Tax=Didymodactylos carnosus TaxID=1234261 RepID=A0A8S2D525_9BILA|nr:unnamed protein product [Didymodactylos carnosus]CAF3629849.1 unnamed protein product [Didymodactylos carnosus]
MLTAYFHGSPKASVSFDDYEKSFLSKETNVYTKNEWYLSSAFLSKIDQNKFYENHIKFDKERFLYKPPTETKQMVNTDEDGQQLPVSNKDQNVNDDKLQNDSNDDHLELRTLRKRKTTATAAPIEKHTESKQKKYTALNINLLFS